VRIDERDARATDRTGRELFVLVIIVLFVVLVVILVEQIAVFGSAFFGFFLLFLIVIGDAIQMHGMSLRNFELGFTLGTRQNFPFLDFVFVDVDFSGTLRAADHGSILRRIVRILGRNITAAPCSVLYTALEEVNGEVEWSASTDNADEESNVTG
jgi:hypothetical protein